MAELKTKKTNASVKDFLDAIPDERRRKECKTMAAMMKRVTGCKPAMWGENMVGYGSYHYKYASGREGDWFPVGFSPRKQNLTIYILSGFQRHNDLMKKLGKFKTGSSCLYVNSLDDINLDVLEQLIREAFTHMRTTSALR